MTHREGVLLKTEDKNIYFTIELKLTLEVEATLCTVRTFQQNRL